MTMTMTNKQMIEWLNKPIIEAVLREQSRSRLAQLEIFETIDSTNTYLLTLAKNVSRSAYVCLAEEQTHGRGRQGKVWFSPKGTNIYCSLLWHFLPTQTDISSLSLAVGVMIIRALQRYGIHQAIQLKWPNDIYFSDRKLAGILVEGLPSREKKFPVVIGVGLNLQSPKENPVAQMSIGLEEIAQCAVSRNQLAGLLIDELLYSLPYYETHGLSAFLDEWREADQLQGQYVVIRTSQYEVTGIALGIDKTGALTVRDQYGKLHAFRCGEVSARLQRP